MFLSVCLCTSLCVCICILSVLQCTSVIKLDPTVQRSRPLLYAIPSIAMHTRRVSVCLFLCFFLYVCVCLSLCVCIACFLYVLTLPCVTLCMCVIKILSTIQRSRPFLCAVPWFVDRCMGNTPFPVIALS